MSDERKQFMIEEATGNDLIFRNFSGKRDRFIPEGHPHFGTLKNFGVILNHDTAKKMLKDGWNVKYLAAREEGDEETPWIKVGISFKTRAPRIVMITSTGQVHLDEDMLEILDWADIRSVDLIATAYDWEVADKSGTKAYLKTMVVTIEEDELERKYSINQRRD